MKKPAMKEMLLTFDRADLRYYDACTSGHAYARELGDGACSFSVVWSPLAQFWLIQQLAQNDEHSYIGGAVHWLWVRGLLPMWSLSRYDLKGLDFARAKFISVAMDEVIFKETDLNQAFFQHADLSGSVFMESDLYGATFVMTDLTLAGFCEQIMEKVHFTQCKISQAAFERASLLDGKLEQCNLDGSSFERSKLKDTLFLSCTMRVTFESTSVENCTFIDCSFNQMRSIAHAQFRNCTFTRCSFDRAHLEDPFVDCTFIDCTLDDAHWPYKARPPAGWKIEERDTPNPVFENGAPKVVRRPTIKVPPALPEPGRTLSQTLGETSAKSRDKAVSER